MIDQQAIPPTQSDAPSSDRRSVRERMEELGWSLEVCDDTLQTGWILIGPPCGNRYREVINYHTDARFHQDLARCTEEAIAAGALVND